jgi:glycosyltransferase involved in cell wall biosynthesis
MTASSHQPPLQSPSSGAEVPPPISRPYLLVIHIPVYVDGNGRRWVDALWHKDLVLHLDYIGDFTLACPHIHREPPPGCLSLEGLPIRFIELPRLGGEIRNVLAAPKVILALWRAVGGADLVHSSVGNWNPLSLGNITFMLAELRRKFRLIVVESSPWRLLPGRNAGVKDRLAAAASEMVNRLCVSTADLSVFTQADYQKTLLTHPERGYVINASWINESDILPEQAAEEAWSRKSKDERVRFLFAGRLTPSKGVLDLLAAAKSLEGTGVRIAVDIMGAGELREACVAAQSQGPDVVVRALDPLEYGPKFLEALGGYHAVLVPNLGDEQPRIVYDAYARAVAVLASATPGLKDCVEDEVTGRFFAPGSVADLARTMKWAAGDVPALRTLGLNGRRRAETLTHRQMHSQRHAIIAQALRASGRGAGSWSSPESGRPSA